MLAERLRQKRIEIRLNAAASNSQVFDCIQRSMSGTKIIGLPKPLAGSPYNKKGTERGSPSEKTTVAPVESTFHSTSATVLSQQSRYYRLPPLELKTRAYKDFEDSKHEESNTSMNFSTVSR